MGFIKGPSALFVPELEAYDKFFGGDVVDDTEALDELFLVVWPRRRKATS
jgi:hypothetical protein